MRKRKSSWPRLVRVFCQVKEATTIDRIRAILKGIKKELSEEYQKTQSKSDHDALNKLKELECELSALDARSPLLLGDMEIQNFVQRV